MAVEMSEERKRLLEGLDPRTQAAALKFQEALDACPDDAKEAIRAVVSDFALDTHMFQLVFGLEALRDHLIPGFRLLLDSMEVAAKVSIEQRDAKTH